MRMMMLTIRVLSIVMFADGEVDNKRSDYVDEDKGHDVSRPWYQVQQTSYVKRQRDELKVYYCYVKLLETNVNFKALVSAKCIRANLGAFFAV
ncbi:hypothetical protein RRG08_041074 [Elysia crispata]|uniref:Secreted protein n=1 Tax=Elysia crispata TaxID=231223 RepID=A0AAE0Y8Q5_9GAST|nr:hypothetical protein RRG08_041074 [Elysia crispata]